jgi:hypothetical protein
VSSERDLRSTSLTGTQRCFWRTILLEEVDDEASSFAEASACCLMKAAALEVTVPMIHSAEMGC